VTNNKEIIIRVNKKNTRCINDWLQTTFIITSGRVN
jgi:hypothetical protein